jgi:serine/threonine protein kinase
MSSPRVLRIVDIIDSPEPMQVMEFLGAGSLHDRLRAGRPTLLEGLGWIDDMLLGLADMHRASLLHRDLTPKNLLLTTEGRLVVADFGTVRHLDDVTLTAAGEHFGSLIYISAQHFENPHTALTQDDLYSVGQIAFEMLTGLRPQGNVGSLEQHAPELAGDRRAVVRLVDSMRAYRREDRPADAIEASVAWRAVLQSEVPEFRRADEDGSLSAGLPLNAAAPWRLVLEALETLFGSIETLPARLQAGPVPPIIVSDAMELQRRIWAAAEVTHRALDRHNGRAMAAVMVEPPIVLRAGAGEHPSFQGMVALVEALAGRAEDIRRGTVMLVPRSVRRFVDESFEELRWKEE